MDKDNKDAIISYARKFVPLTENEAVEFCACFKAIRVKKTSISYSA